MNNLKANLQNIYSRVEAACAAVGRERSEITILAVSKQHPASRIRALFELGQTRFGENYVQEALEKQQALADLQIEWHFIGPLQSNKTKEVAAHFDWAQSADRRKILRRLSEQRPSGLPPLNVLLQVNIDREPQKAGLAPEEVMDMAQYAGELNGLRLRGLMAIPKPTETIEEALPSYRKMKQLFDRLVETGFDVDTLSMGMSADLEAAIMAGSTMVRIGTDLLGPRPGPNAEGT
jgi:pyridoxal phosphate enzyme (YggS family)